VIKVGDHWINPVQVESFHVERNDLGGEKFFITMSSGTVYNVPGSVGEELGIEPDVKPKRKYTRRK
jgi:hypothetical protein